MQKLCVCIHTLLSLYYEWMKIYGILKTCARYFTLSALEFLIPFNQVENKKANQSAKLLSKVINTGPCPEVLWLLLMQSTISQTLWARVCLTPIRTKWEVFCFYLLNFFLFFFPFLPLFSFSFFTFILLSPCQFYISSTFISPSLSLFYYFLFSCPFVLSSIAFCSSWNSFFILFNFHSYSLCHMSIYFFLSSTLYFAKRTIKKS